MPPSESEIRSIVQRVIERLSDAAGSAKEETHPPSRRSQRQMVNEDAVRQQQPGSRLVVEPGALVTPLARQLARDRGVKLDESGLPDVSVASGPSERRIAIGADHGGFATKEALKPHLVSLGYEVVDCGTHSEQAVDYPDIAYAVARLVSEGKCANGIVIDGAGIGSCMVANKVPQVRAAMCYDHATAVNSREHNHANVLTLGAGQTGANLAKQIVSAWLSTPYGPGRHARRVEKIMAIERRFSR